MEDNKLIELKKIITEGLWVDSSLDNKPNEDSFQPDRRDGSIYLMNNDLKVAIAVALTTSRPLLLKGETGTGKSSIAPYIARNLDWRYYEHVVTARTEARDILYRFDAVRRLADSQNKDPKNTNEYINPGVLWWTINRDDALKRGCLDDNILISKPFEPFGELNEKRVGGGAVLLIDEIDKADPDVPNNLLVALGSFIFEIPEIDGIVKSSLTHKITVDPQFRISNILVIITTNEEKDLPKAFLRRCIVHELTLPKKQEEFVGYMVAITKKHWKHEELRKFDKDGELVRNIAKQFFKCREDMRKENMRLPGTAEFLDAIRACFELKIKFGDPKWNIIERITIKKSTN